jgi:homoserine kinase type II
MAVYTEISDAELCELIGQYDIGEVVACKGIAEGVENSNYLLRTEKGEYILTLYEKRVRAEDLPFFLGLLDHLAAKGLQCPVPIHGRDGKALRWAAGRPAAIVSFLEGVWVRSPGVAHCAQVGEALARLHLAGEGFGLHRPNALSLDGWRTLVTSCQTEAAKVRPALGEEIAAELAVLEQAWPRELPAGVIHADLFRDNVFFRGERLSGLIDFYFACNDFLAYDIAVCLNDWCFEADGAFNLTKGRAMLRGYRAVRPLSGPEAAALPILARGAAFRFLLTRLYDWLNQVPGALVRPKDPLEYWRKLCFHRAVTGPAAYGLD